MAEQKWYKPVNLGCHYLNFIAEENISSEDVARYFHSKGDHILTPMFEQELNSLVEEWRKHDDGSISPEFQNDPYFIPNNEYLVEYAIGGFSEDSVNVMFFFRYGASRWHHYNALLKNLIIPRSSVVDSIFNMIYYDDLYTTSYKGIGYGSSESNMETALGTGYYEYIGQSIQLKNVFYKQENMEICLQDGIVKYVKEGRPSWMESENIQKHKENDSSKK